MSGVHLYFGKIGEIWIGGAWIEGKERESEADCSERKVEARPLMGLTGQDVFKEEDTSTLNYR